MKRLVKKANSDLLDALKSACNKGNYNVDDADGVDPNDGCAYLISASAISNELGRAVTGQDLQKLVDELYAADSDKLLETVGMTQADFLESVCGDTTKNVSQCDLSGGVSLKGDSICIEIYLFDKDTLNNM